jgi:hypothetical protein
VPRPTEDPLDEVAIESVVAQVRMALLQARKSLGAERKELARERGLTEQYRQALKWFVAHDAIYSPALQTVVRGKPGSELFFEVPRDVLTIVAELALELSLEAEHAG